MDHFSIFGIAGNVIVAPSAPSGPRAPGGGGGGASGVASGEPRENIEKYETRDQFLYVNREVVYRFTSGLPVYELAVTATKNTGLISARVELLRGTSKLVDSAPGGTVYKNLNIWLGTRGFATPENIKDAAIRFKVEKSWLSDNNFAKEDMSLVKWEEDRWLKLATQVIDEDSDYVYYEAHTNSFSPFAIVAKPTAVEAVAPGVPVTPTVTPTETPGAPEKTAVPTPTKKGIPGFEVVLSVLALTIGAAWKWVRLGREGKY